MAYAEGNPKTKKEPRAWVAMGKRVKLFGPGIFPAKTGWDGNCRRPTLS